jgi:hypothetical protein
VQPVTAFCPVVDKAGFQVTLADPPRLASVAPDPVITVVTTTVFVLAEVVMLEVPHATKEALTLLASVVVSAAFMNVLHDVLPPPVEVDVVYSPVLKVWLAVVLSVTGPYDDGFTVTTFEALVAAVIPRFAQAFRADTRLAAAFVANAVVVVAVGTKAPVMDAPEPLQEAEGAAEMVPPVEGKLFPMKPEPPLPLFVNVTVRVFPLPLKK